MNGLKVSMLIILLLLAGCQLVATSSNGPEVEIVERKTSLDVSSIHSSELEGLIDSLVNEHKNVLSSELILVEIGTENIEKKNVEDALKNLGINTKVIILNGSKSERRSLITFVYHQSLVNVCNGVSLLAMNEKIHGCFVENARWSSIVNPEKMLFVKEHQSKKEKDK